MTLSPWIKKHMNFQAPTKRTTDQTLLLPQEATPKVQQSQLCMRSLIWQGQTRIQTQTTILTKWLSDLTSKAHYYKETEKKRNSEQEYSLTEIYVYDSLMCACLAGIPCRNKVSRPLVINMTWAIDGDWIHTQLLKHEIE